MRQLRQLDTPLRGTGIELDAPYEDPHEAPLLVCGTLGHHLRKGAHVRQHLVSQSVQVGLRPRLRLELGQAGVQGPDGLLQLRNAAVGKLPVGRGQVVQDVVNRAQGPTLPDCPLSLRGGAASGPPPCDAIMHPWRSWADVYDAWKDAGRS